MLENGTTLRSANYPGIFRSEALPLTPTQRRIISALVRVDAPIKDTDLAEACLQQGQQDSDDRLELLDRHVSGLRQSLKCRNLVRSRRGELVQGTKAYFLNADVRQVNEAEHWEPMTSVAEGANPIVSNVLIEPQWFLPQARRSGASIELHEIAVMRMDTAICLIGYESSAFDECSLRFFVARYEPSASGLLEWAGVIDSSNLEYSKPKDDGKREIFAVETKPKEQLRMVMGPTGAKLRLAWNVRPDTQAALNTEYYPATIKFTCDGITYSTQDGTEVHKHLPDKTKHTLALGSVSARLLLLFLNRAVTGSVTNEEIWNAIWPDQAFTDRSAHLIRQSIYRVRRDLGADIIVNVGASSRYRLNAQLHLSLEGHPTLPEGLERMPTRIVLPSGFVYSGPEVKAEMTLYEIRALGPDGNFLTLGFAPDDTLSSLAWLLSDKSQYGRHYLRWAGLDPSCAQRCTRFGNIWRVGNDENHLLVFADDSLTVMWLSLREPPPDSVMAHLNTSA